jgi:hypothetical protein
MGDFVRQLRLVRHAYAGPERLPKGLADEDRSRNGADRSGWYEPQFWRPSKEDKGPYARGARRIIAICGERWGWGNCLSSVAGFVRIPGRGVLARGGDSAVRATVGLPLLGTSGYN